MKNVIFAPLRILIALMESHDEELSIISPINQLEQNDMKKLFLLFLSLVATLTAVAEISVCGVFPDDKGNFDCPFIKSGTVTWNASSRTLTLDNAIVEYSSETPYDYISPIRVTENATIVIHGECRLRSTGFVAMSLDGYDSKSVTIQGDGRLVISSILRGIFLVCTRLTIRDITLDAANSVGNNGDGVLCALTFDHVKADIHGGVARIGEGITLRNCAITYPADAYIVHDESEYGGYGYYIAYGDDNFADHIIISRESDVVGDVNGDGEVNIADVNVVIGIILDGHGDEAAADVNGDREVNIADVNAIINIILGGDEPTPSATETITVKGVSFKMVKVVGGTFTMGATVEQGSDAADNEKPAHQVTLSSFSIGETEVTQALWVAVMGTNPSFFKTGDLNLPVELVTWDACQEFITKLNQMTGKQFRLPTEAEWEFAARGGNKSKRYKYSGGNNVDEVAWYWMNCGSITHAVGSKKANELGLYDMSGNVQEWCNDFWGDYTAAAQTNPTGPASGVARVIRGGFWGTSDPASCRVSYRDADYPFYLDDARGLRLAQ